jgi:NAD(P)-dependent dehydrogenase (short-subunit alcohol dehydrogenase family)
MKKTILITGASSGFGLMLANDLQQKGFNVIGTSREPEKYRGKVSFKLLRLDISDDASIEAFTRELAAETKQLDVLVNNAGSATVAISDYDAYRPRVNAFTKKGIDQAEAPDGVVNTITKLIGAKEPKFSNPVGKMTGMILFLQSYAHKMFEGSILKSVKTAI